MRRGIALCLAVSLCAGLNAGGNPGIYKKGWIDFNKNGIKDIYEDPSAPIDARVKDLLSQMSLDEKTCQMATLYGSGRVLKDSLPTANWKNEIWKDGIANHIFPLCPQCRKPAHHPALVCGEYPPRHTGRFYQ